jgi:hypothetical protein
MTHSTDHCSLALIVNVILILNLVSPRPIPHPHRSSPPSGLTRPTLARAAFNTLHWYGDQLVKNRCASCLTPPYPVRFCRPPSPPHPPTPPPDRQSHNAAFASSRDYLMMTIRALRAKNMPMARKMAQAVRWNSSPLVHADRSRRRADLPACFIFGYLGLSICANKPFCFLLSNTSSVFSLDDGWSLFVWPCRDSAAPLC